MTQMVPRTGPKSGTYVPPFSVDESTLKREDYTHDGEGPTYNRTGGTAEHYAISGRTMTLEPQRTVLPTGLEVRLTVREYGFNQLSDMLIELERKHGRSTLELFQEYITGELSLDEDESVREWVSLILLYLGTKEVRRWACP